MNKDINKTLMALVPILRMNGENVTNIEAVHDWYKAGDREYMKEVAEITYDNGTVRYADIGCDSNLTAIYDVIAVIQQIKPRSKAIERIERGVYSLPSAQPEPCEDAVSRKAAIDECNKRGAEHIGYAIAHLPSAQPDNDRIWSALSKVYNMESVPDEAKAIIGDVMLGLDEPSVQPEKVKCKKCRYVYYDKEFGNYWCNRKPDSFMVEEDGYCKWGK